MVLDDGLWHHPLFAEAFDDVLRIRLQEAARRAGEIVDELSRLPLGTGHCDASSNNLLVIDEDNGFILIDYGTWNEAPIGFDLGQLLVGDVQIGRRAASLLSETEEAILPAYVAGLGDEGYDLDAAVVRRAHALHLLLFTGLSTPPFDYLDAATSPALLHIAKERASIARFSLDLLDETAPV
ncbi:MAG: phosphotransferase [Arachnia sp.]